MSNDSLAKGNAVTIGADVNLPNAVVDGGRSGLGDVENNSVLASGGKVREIHGGYSFEGNALNNNVTLNGSTVGGGSFPDSGLFGGWAQNGTVSNNSVLIQSGSVDNVYGGFINLHSGELKNNSITMTGGSVTGGLFGALSYVNSSGDGSSAASAVSNSVYLQGGYVEKSIVGGFTNEKPADDNIVKISNGTVAGNIYGGWALLLALSVIIVLRLPVELSAVRFMVDILKMVLLIIMLSALVEGLLALVLICSAAYLIILRQTVILLKSAMEPSK